MIELVNEVMKIEGLPSRDKATLFCLATMANIHKRYSNSPCAFPSQRMLSDSSGNKKTALTSSLQSLEKGGLIQILRYAKKTDSGATHVYVLTLPRQKALPLGGNPANKESREQGIPHSVGGFPASMGGLSREAVTNRNNHKKSNTNVESVYELYPRKVAKPQALRAITKVLKSYSLEEVKEKTTLYSEAVRGMDKQFIPHPATWFNQERFNDDPATWNPSADKQPSKIDDNQIEERLKTDPNVF